VIEGAERNLSRIQKLAAFVGVDGSDEDAVGGAGDEVADALLAGEKGHGVAEGLGRIAGGIDGVSVSAGAGVHVGFVGTAPGGAAAAEGSLAAGRAESWSGREGGCRGRVRDGFEECGFCNCDLGHRSFSYEQVCAGEG
jgi:hypothetical protein